MGNLVQGFPFCFLGGNYMKINKPWEKLITIGIIIIIAAGMWFLSIPCPFLWVYHLDTKSARVYDSCGFFVICCKKLPKSAHRT